MTFRDKLALLTGASLVPLYILWKRYNTPLEAPKMRRMTIEDDEANLVKFDKIIASATSDGAKRLWMTKKAQYLNNMRWRVLEDNAQGVEKVG